jgi:hypothetical protein
MATLVSRNTIKLAADASATDNYYLNYMLTLKRVDSFGRELTQKKKIIGYIGASKIATIEGIWAADFVPGPGDTYDITPYYPDSRVSINPAIQSLDYMTSVTYGRGLNAIDDLKLDTWLNSARICDTRSDIWVEFSGTAPSIDAIYIAENASVFQGTVAEVDGTYVRFTNVIGKLSYQWSNWRDFKNLSLVYEGANLYKRTSGSGAITTKPVHTSGTLNGLQYISSYSLTKTAGGGPATLPIATDGNPVRYKKNGVPVSGYTLYDSDGVDYFRLIGWDVNEQRSVTRHQTNITIDTALPLFDNMNSTLEHFGGILRYSGDKYVLEVEEAEGDISNTDNEPRNITNDHIIGRISISDNGIKDSYNSLTVAYTDPANKFEARNISFFNSEFLKADRNVPKKGNLTIPGITNYYNARILADKFLTKSRYGLSINMNLAPRGVLLLAGKVVQLQYPRYGWIDKKFRIENLTHNDDCTVDIVATEYDDSFYTISNISKPTASGLAGTQALTTLDPPSGLITTNITAGNELISAIELSWLNSGGANSPLVTTEIYASYSPNLDVEIDSITGGQTLTTVENPHGLKVGQSIFPQITSGVLIAGVAYYVKSVTANTFTLSNVKGGSTITTLTNTTDNFLMRTAAIIANVTPPTNSYIDSDIYDMTGYRVEKYYWLRYKINQQ